MISRPGRDWTQVGDVWVQAPSLDYSSGGTFLVIERKTDSYSRLWTCLITEKDGTLHTEDYYCDEWNPDEDFKFAARLCDEAAQKKASSG